MVKIHTQRYDRINGTAEFKLIHGFRR